MPSLVKLFVAGTALGAAALGYAAPAQAWSHVVHEKRETPMRSWAKRDRVDPAALLPVKIGLKQENLHLGEDWLMEVADPTSSKYSQHWTPQEVTAAFAPHRDTVDSLRTWLNEAGISGERVKQSVNKGWLSFQATAAEAEALFKAEFYEHEHMPTGKMSIACDEYHLPAHVSPLVDYVTPGIKTAQLKKRKFSPNKKPSPGPFMQLPQLPHSELPKTNLTNCNRVITPACVAALYEIPEPATHVHPGNALGIFEEGDFYAQKDLDLFFVNFTPYIPQGTHPTLDSIDGGEAPVPVKQAGGESDLDFQLAYPIVYPQEIVLYQVDDINYAEDIIVTAGFGNTFLDALDGSYCKYTAYNETGDSPTLDPIYPDTHKNGYKGQLMCGTYKPTNVITISYGLQEDDLPAGYQQRQCNEFLKLGLQGVSIFVASGDTGVAGTRGDGNPNGCLGPKANVFNPTNPNSCPWLTNVGATMISPKATVHDPESAAFGFFDNGTFLFTSSGGFSNIYPVPKYQQAAVDKYFEKYNPPYPYYKILNGFNASKIGNGIYNRIGHGIPDVAANGMNIGVYNAGKYQEFGGTSASSPIFASIVNRINDARLNAGKKSIGFINPSLYQNPYILNDITNGTNPGCKTQGFKAVPGWDPVTGLGTPNYPRMLEFFLKLP